MFLRSLPALLFLSLVLAWPPDASGQTPAGWQQHVAYEMDVTLFADDHELKGYQRLVYTNNSPDTLYTAYYHLYFNAFNPQSAMAARNRVLPDPDSRVVPRIFNLGPEEIGYHKIRSLTQDGEPVDFTITGTVMRVDLAHPILPGASTVFEMRYYSQVPLQTRRSGRDNREGIDFSMSQWYPKIAAYDGRGWHPDPYIGREFYAPFGSFDVEITAPAEYTIGGTGVLQNPEEVDHGYDQTGLWRPDAAAYAPTDSLTWHFVAERVHDFAWAADPDYIHERFEAEGVTYHLLYQPRVEDNWEPMDRWVPTLIQFYSEAYGPYPYPQFTAIQAGDGGMEYPMVNFLTGRRSPRSLLGVTAHEAAHEWFYAILATNESDYAWMDEGFTSYATAEAMAYILGRPPNHTSAYLSVLQFQYLDLFERLNTPADWFTTNAAYGVASYPGGEMVVDMLGYVISDPLLAEWLEEYYERFKFRHPSPFDLERLAENVSGLHLDWYFEQFLNTTRRLDYALEGFYPAPARGGEWQATIILERQDEIVMPADVRITFADGSEQWVTVPLGVMQGHKPVPDDWIVGEPWQWPFPEYTITIRGLESRPVGATLDPLGKTPDYNRLNNTAGFPVEARFLRPPGQDWFDYRIGWRPLAQYASNFGFGLGLTARGQYLFGKHRLDATLKLWPQVVFSGGEEPELEGFFEREGPPGPDPVIDNPIDASWFTGVDYELTYATNLRDFGPLATLEVSAEKHLGFLENTITFSKPLAPILADYDARLTASLVHQLNPTDRVFGRFEDMFRSQIICYDPYWPCGPAGPDPALSTFTRYVNAFQKEHMLSARVGVEVESGNGDRVAAMLEVGSSLDGPGAGAVLNPDPDLRQTATRFLLEATKTAPLGPLTARADFAFGFGDEDLVLYKQFRLGAASFEERWRDAAFRTAAAPFHAPLADAHLAAFSSAGPVAYLLAADDGDVRNPVGGTPVGQTLVAGRLALSTGSLSESDWLAPLRSEPFSGIGEVWNDGAFLAGFEAENLLADAGIGVRYDVSEVDALSRWIRQSEVLQGLEIVAKFPLWASDPERIDAGQDPLAFRWLIGISVGE